MEPKAEEFTTITFEDGTCAVMRADPGRPRFMEVIATFYDAARAKDYAQAENTHPHKPKEEAAPKKKAATKSRQPVADLSARQLAVLKALRANMDKSNLVEIRAAPLAEAAQIPLGSLHSILGSLEKRHFIHTQRQGTLRYPAIYRVLDTPKESVQLALARNGSE